MPRFAANLTLMYVEHAFLDRFAAAAADGFRAVEIQFPYNWPAAELSARLRGNGLTLALFNAPPGDFDRGDRGVACDAGRRAEFREGVERALEYAQALDCARVHVMAGLVPPGADVQRLRATYIENIAWAAGAARSADRNVLIEPLNARDVPGYLLHRQAEAHDIVRQIAAPNLKVQMDLYHCQIDEGDIEMKLREHLPSGRVGHVQVASVPKRREPDEGELNYPHLFGVLDELGYDGWVGCEYRPRGGTSDGLGWLRAARG